MSPDEYAIGDGSPEDAEVARVLDDYLAALEAGRPPDPDRLLAEHPALAEQLRGCLEVMHLAGQVAGSGDAGPDEDDGAPPGPRLDDFRIVRQVGRGGMGIVYEAEQRSLRRRVALKVLPLASAIDPRQLRRFHVEAQAAAQLHHTHIVPVYAVGCERGVHYYAMQYIEGKSLAELIRELRQLEGRDAAEEVTTVVLDGVGVAGLLASGQLAPPAKVAAPGPAASPPPDRPRARAAGHSPSASTRTAAYFRTVANLGIQAAEALEHAHQEGVVHRDIKPANVMVDVKGHLWIADFGLARLQNDSGLTMSGDLVGTIRYMSPEQAIGRRAAVDQRTDIYALGVTLYELVALEPAFDGADRREVLRRIIEEGPRPLRALNPAAPRELETIIRKAMAGEPDSRYPTAQELADDLRRFLEHKPIRARRPTPLEYAAKWSRRHIALVISAAVMLCVAAAGLAISTAMIAGKQAEVVRQRDEARRHEERARQILDELYTGLSERWLAEDSGDAEMRRELLGKAAAYYEEFARAPSRTPEIRLEVAHAWLRVGRICWLLRRVPEGEAAYRRALALFEDLAGDGRIDPLEARDGAAYVMDRLGDLLWIAGRDAEAADLYARAIDVCRSILARHPDHLAARLNLAAARMSLGDLRDDPPGLREAEATYRGILADLLARRADVRPVADLLARHRVLVDIPHPSAAAAASGPDAHRPFVRDVYTYLAEIGDHLEHFAEAEDDLRRALDLSRAPAGGSRNSERRVCASLHRRLAEVLRHAGRDREAAQAYRDAMALVPNDPKLYEGLAVLLASGQDPRVRDPREAMRLAQRGIDLVPDDGHIWQALGVACYRAGEWAEAAAALDRTMSLRGGGGAADKLYMAMSHWRLGHPDVARGWYARGIERTGSPGGHAGARGSDPKLDRLRAEAASLLGLNDEPLAVKDAR